MKTVLSAAGLTPPPVPVSLVEQFRRLDRWLYATRTLGRGDMYETSLPLELFERPVDDYVALGHSGHGLNSYTLTYCLVWAPLAVFIERAWGGAYMDQERSNAEINRLYKRCFDVVRLARTLAHRRSTQGRLIVVESEIGMSRVRPLCGWLQRPLENQDQTRAWIEDASCHSNALDTAVRLLEGKADGTSGL